MLVESKAFFKKHKSIIVIVLIALLAFFIRLCFYLQLDQTPATDSALYAYLGKSLALGNGYVGPWEGINLIWSPFYPFTIAIGYMLTHDAVLSGQVSSLLFGSLLIVPLFIFSKKVFSEEIALICSLFAAVSFPLIQYSVVIMSESEYMFFLMAGILAGYMAYSEKKNAYYAIAGIAFGISYLIRPEGIGYLLVVILVTVISYSRGVMNVRRQKKISISLGMMALCFLIVASPYLLFLHAETGHWMLSGKGYFNVVARYYSGDYEPIIYGVTDSAKSINLYNVVNQSTLSFIKNNIGIVLDNYLQNTYIQDVKVLPEALPIVLIAFAAIGIVFGNIGDKRKNRLNKLYILLLIVYGLIIYPVFIVKARYIVPTLPLLMILSASGTLELGSWLKRSIARYHSNMNPALALAVPALALVILILPTIQVFASSMQDNYDLNTVTSYADDPGYNGQWAGSKEAGIWAKEHLPLNATIMARKPNLALYADRQGVLLPYGNLSEVLAYAKYHNVTYVVIERQVMDRPELDQLYDDDARISGLKLAYKQNASDYPIYIYEFNAPA